jgi:diguanylate cyclase (GGDEF)-like protein/PAS domain S-box-containing protein
MGRQGRTPGPAPQSQLRQSRERRRALRVLARREAMLAEAEQAAGFGSFHHNLISGETDYSPGFYTVLGLAPDEEITPESLLELTHPEDRDLPGLVISRAREDREPFELDLRIRRPDGQPITVRIRGRVVFDERDTATRLVGTVQDVSHEVEARAARELLSAVVESSDDAILTKDSGGVITSWNRGAERLYGYTAQEAVGSRISILEPPELQGQQEEITRQVFAGQPLHHFVTERLRKDGSRISVSLTISPVRDANGRIVMASVIARDVTERERYEQRLRYLADHDQLTGLVNRRRFDEELTRELARAGRHQSTGAMLSIDIDNFKQVNDSAGHTAGDAVLVEVANLLSRRFRATDVVARLGGDEFAVLLTDVGPVQAQRTAEDLLRSLAAARPAFGGRPLRVSASIGVAPFAGDDATVHEVLVNADLAMYAAKNSGRNRVVLHSPSQAQRAREMMREPWPERIRHALKHDRFVFHLQPIVDLASGRIAHGELLLRMLDQRGRVIAPGAFLPSAERHGLIHDVDRWVVEHAIQLMASRQAGSIRPVGVNLSGESVAAYRQLLRLIERELTRAEVDPQRLIFEISETVAIANLPQAYNFAAALTELGCRLALDDFGTGVGSFYYLKHLPLAYVKLDGDYIRDLAHSPVDEHVIRAIVEVARALGIKTVAESVGDEATITLLRAHGVDYAQGYHLGVPKPLDEAD